LINQAGHSQNQPGPTPGTFGLSSSRGDRSLVGSFGERYGGAAVGDAGPTKNSSSIQSTVIDPSRGAAAAHKQWVSCWLFLKSWRRSPASRSCADNCSLPVKCTQSISEATIIQTFPIQTLRGSIVCKISDNTFTKLRITRAYIKLLCIPEGDARVVSLAQVGNYEIRML
jgi:hypothetical protein